MCLEIFRQLTHCNRLPPNTHTGTPSPGRTRPTAHTASATSTTTSSGAIALRTATTSMRCWRSCTRAAPPPPLLLLLRRRQQRPPAAAAGDQQHEQQHRGGDWGDCGPRRGCAGGSLAHPKSKHQPASASQRASAGGPWGAMGGLLEDHQPPS